MAAVEGVENDISRPRRLKVVQSPWKRASRSLTHDCAQHAAVIPIRDPLQPPDPRPQVPQP